MFDFITDAPGAASSYYGSYRTRTFGQIFESADSFIEAYQNCGIEQLLTENSMRNLFYLLYARYGNSPIANAVDENQFVYAVFSTCFMYGPTWEKRLEVQKKLRELAFDDGENGIFRGGKAVYNHAYNPGTAPSTSSLQELNFINDQNTTNYKKSPLDGYANLIALLDTDVTEEFISKFNKLFLNIVAPDYPLIYTTPKEEQFT